MNSPHPNGGRHLNRRLLYGALFAIVALLSVGAWYSARRHQQPRLPTKAEAAIRTEPLPDDIMRAAKGYGDLPATKPEPPQPNRELEELRAQLNQLQAKLNAQQSAHPVVTTTPKATTPNAEEQRRAQEAREAAKAEREAQKAARQSALSAIRHDKAEDEAKRSGLQPRQSPTVLYAGTLIPVTLYPGLNSESPGTIIAKVRETVMDSLTGEIPIIPQDSTFVGRYQNAIFGQERVNSTWSLLTLRNGDSVKMDGLSGSDVTGQNGHGGEVNAHWGRLVASVFIGSVLRAGAMATTVTGEGMAERAAGAVSQDVASKGTQQVQRILNTDPTITVKPGTAATIILQQPLDLPAYRGS